MPNHGVSVIVDPRSIGIHYNDHIRLAGRNAVADEIRWRLNEIKDDLEAPLHLTVCSVPKTT